LKRAYVSMEKTLLARQPIFDYDGNIFAYELLFRDSRKNSAVVQDNRYATSHVLSNSFNAFGLDKIVSGNKAFVNVDAEFLHDDVIESIPAERFVLEILEDVQVDKALINRIAELKDKGYTFAIDDLNLNDEAQIKNFTPLLEHSDFAKIDILLTRDIKKIQEKLDFFSRFPNLNLLAEKVETSSIHNDCKKMGFHYFQGYFFAKPKIMQAKKFDVKHASIIKLIEKLNKGASIAEIETEFNYNPSLTVGLLRYINSSNFSTKKEISSIPQAINLLGRQPLIQWLTLCLYSTADDNKYKNSLLQTVMLRGELMMSMAKRYQLGKERADKAYLIGLVSLLNALLHIPLDAIFSDIPFDKEIEKAVLQRDGVLGKLLKIVSVFEKGDFAVITGILGKIKMGENELSDMMSQCYVNVISKDAFL